MPSMTTTPGLISGLNQIQPMNSPMFVTLSSPNPFTHMVLYLWIWKGNLNAPFVSGVDPNVILYKEKVSTSDTSVRFEISNYVRDLITPDFSYTSGVGVHGSGEGVYFKYEWTPIYNPNNINNPTVPPVTSSPTYFGTLGYMWNYENNQALYPFPINSVNPNNMSFGFNEQPQPTKGYDPSIKYYDYTFNFVNGTTSSTMVIPTTFTPPLDNYVCGKEPFLIAYLDKRGLWNTFTPTGKVMVDVKSDKEAFTRTYRNPQLFNNGRMHEKKELNRTAMQTYTINTGIIREDQGQYIEEIINSPLVYLIEFKKTVGQSGLYNSWRSIPVTCATKDFNKKTRLNDKNKVSYTLKFEEASQKIRNIR